MTQIKKDPNIYKDNTYEFEFSVYEPRESDGKMVPSTGRTDLFVWFSEAEEADPDTPIHSELKVDATERTAKPGTYWGDVPGAKITEHMFTAPVDYDRKTVYVAGGDVTGDTLVVEKVKAYRVRKVSADA